MARIRAHLVGIVGLIAIAYAAAGTPPTPGQGHYEGAGVVVVAAGGQGTGGTFLDNGAVVCEDTDGNGSPDHGVGGACLRFDELAGDSILVADAVVPASQLAFQVCVDNNGDGLCSGNGEPGHCEDRIVFSHRTSDGANFNPLWVDPFGSKLRWLACGGNGFPGFVVITCAGVHANTSGIGTHPHQATEGLVQGATTGGTLSGDFCGAPNALKAYVLV